MITSQKFICKKVFTFSLEPKNETINLQKFQDAEGTLQQKRRKISACDEQGISFLKNNRRAHTCITISQLLREEAKQKGGGGFWQ